MKDHRAWIQKTLAHQEPGAVPYNFMFSPPAQRALERYYGTGDLADALELPIRMTGPRSIKPLYASPAKYGPSVKDEFGVVWSTNEIDRGSPIGPCLPEADLTDYRFPEAGAEDRYRDLREWCRTNEKHYTILWVGDLWERATFMCGMENLLLDLAVNPRFVHALLDGIADYVLATMRVLFDRFRFDGVAVSDDYGIQNAMLMSPATWRRFVRPRLARVYSLAKTHGRTVFHHSCGHIRPIIPEMIELGLDILHPIQPEAMDVFALKREFGRDLTFCGGLRTQDLLPRGQAREVRDEVRRLKRELGRGGGYILEPGITVQADVPLDNMVAMIEEARNDS